MTIQLTIICITVSALHQNSMHLSCIKQAPIIAYMAIHYHIFKCQRCSFQVLVDLRSMWGGENRGNHDRESQSPTWSSRRPVFKHESFAPKSLLFNQFWASFHRGAMNVYMFTKWMVLLTSLFQIITQHWLQNTMTVATEVPNYIKVPFLSAIEGARMRQTKHRRQSTLRYRDIVMQIVRLCGFINVRLNSEVILLFMLSHHALMAIKYWRFKWPCVPSFSSILCWKLLTSLKNRGICPQTLSKICL